MPSDLELVGRLALTLVLSAVATTADIATRQLSDGEVAVRLDLQGPGPLEGVVAGIGAIDGVLAVSTEAEEPV